MTNNQSYAGFYELRNAVFSDQDAAEKLVEENPAIVHARNSIGETALHYLAVENYITGVDWLVRHGGDINTKNDFEATPLMESASLGYIELCQYLLAHGADVFVKDQNDGTVFSAASLNNSNDIDKVNLLNLLLKYAGDIDLNDVFDDFEAHRALTQQSPIVVELLSSRGLKYNTEYRLGEPSGIMSHNIRL